LAAGALALLLLGGGVALSGFSGQGEPGAPAGSAGPQALAQTLSAFPREQVLDVAVDMTATDLEQMLANGAQEQEYRASVTWGGQALSNVSIRTKGNSSLRSVAGSDSKRFSFKLDLNQFVDWQSLNGIGTINLNNNFSDPTYMREYLSYEAMESLGIPTPERTWVRLSLNGEPWGLYLAVEQVGTPFLERHFGESTGDLYKPASQAGQGADLKWYGDAYANSPGIVYKGKGQTDHQPLLDLLDALNNNGGDLETVLDIDSVLKYMAACTVMVSTDSYMGQFAHNYYLYEQNGRFSVIPWDFNMSFGGMGGGTELKIDSPTTVALSERPLVGKLLEVPEYKERYHGYIAELIEGYLEPERFEARAREVMALIDPYVKEDPTKFFTYEQFQNSLDQAATSGTQGTQQDVPAPGGGAAAQAQAQGQGRGRGGLGFGGSSMGLITFQRARVTNLQQQLNGTIPTTGGETVSTGNFAQGGRPAPGGNFPPGGRNVPGGNFPPGGNVPPGGGPPQGGGFPQGGMRGEQPPTLEPAAGELSQATRVDLWPIGVAAALLLAGTFLVWRLRPRI